MITTVRPEIILTLAYLALIIFSPLLTLFFSRSLRRVRVVATTLLFLSLSSLALIFFIFDLMKAASISLIFCVSFFVVGTTLTAIIFVRHRSWIALCLGSLLAAGIAVSFFADLTPVKPYKRFFVGIDNGMTETEVMAVLHREFPQGGHFPVPVLRSDDTNLLMFFLDPKQSAYNAEGVFVTLQNGKVVAKVYSPD